MDNLPVRTTSYPQFFNNPAANISGIWPGILPQARGLAPVYGAHWSFWDSAVGKWLGTDTSEATARDRAANDKLAQLNRDLMNRGIITEQEYQDSLDRLMSGDADPNSYSSQVEREFERGVVDAAAGLTPPALLSKLPWWVWVAGGLYLAGQLGLLELAGTSIKSAAKARSRRNRAAYA